MRSNSSPGWRPGLEGRAGAVGPRDGERAASAPDHGRRAYRLAKRGLDVVAAAAGLLLLSPVLVAVAVAVKLSSPGPVFFRQLRVGMNGRPFTILKFRSMLDGTGGPAVTSSGDARVTSVGRVLRHTKLDELPQVWNVLVGDMSLVGPRPEVRKYVDLFRAEYARILTVRPGMTDFAALEYRDEESVLGASGDPEAHYVHGVLPAKIALYRRYLDEMSLKTDLTLIFKTLTALLP